MYLLDTDIVIFSLKGVPEVVENLRRRRRDPLALSVITYGELVWGAEKSERRVENLARVHRVAELYPILEVTRAVMDAFGVLKADLETAGPPIDDFDLLIGATALVHGCCIVTGNARHFRRIRGLDVEDWTVADGT